MALELNYFTGGAREKVLEAILSAGHTVKKVFVNDPERWAKVRSTIQLATKKSLPIRIIKRKNEISELIDEVRGSICFSAGFNYLFPPEFLAATKVSLNVHGSLLPKYAGARTLAWAIEHGAVESGVTVHLIDEGMDTGAILLQKKFPLSPFETTRSLARKTSDFEPDIVIEALAKYEREGKNAFVLQAASEQILPNRIPQHSELDPKVALADLFDKIRAADPVHYPAYFYHAGEKVCVSLWREVKPKDEDDLI